MKGAQKMYEIYEHLLQKHGVTNYRVSKETGIAQSVLSAWKNKKSVPKHDKLEILAKYFGVSIDYLMTGEEKEQDGYYFDERTAQIAQEISERSELGGLFDAARSASPEDILTAQTLLEALKKKSSE